MIAIGILLIVLGIAIVHVYGASPVEAYLKQYNGADYFGTLLVGVGLIVGFIGVVVWAWRALP